MRAELIAIYDKHPDSPRMMYVTKGGLRFTLEQWELMQFMKRVDKKLNNLLSRPHQSTPETK